MTTIAVIGCGYLGAVHATAMASLGHETIGIDIDESKIAALSAGTTPFYEPGLDELLATTLESGRLTFTTDIAQAARASVVFVGVGTPQQAGSHAADLRFVDAAIESLLPHLQPGALVVGKSTVPVGTAARLRDIVAPTGAELMWNPEFLREGFAVEDTLRPDRLVYGVAADDATSVAKLDEVYAPILQRETPRLVTDLATAELVKVSANAFLATKISFINAMAEIAEQVGADVTQLADAIGLDTRIGRRFLNAGLGFGGGCLPKDIRAFQARADELGLGQSLAFLADVDDVNLRRRDRMEALITEELGRVQGTSVAVLGLTFKPDSDDVRDSASLDIAERLRSAGHTVTAYDPKGQHTAAKMAPELDIKDSLAEAIAGASVIALGTEWAEFREADPTQIAGQTSARVVIDGRNVLDRAAWSAAGFRVVSLGRPVVEAA